MANTFKKTCYRNFWNFNIPRIAILFLLSFEVSFVAVTSFEIPIYRQRLITGSFDYAANEENNLSTKSKWDNETIRLAKFMDGEYYGVIRIGSPAKEFKMSFDTTWADSWVPSQHCGLWEIACMIHNKYDGSKSSTYQEDGRPFRTGDTANDMQGYVSKDDFHLAHLTLKNQSFAEITHLPWLPYGFTKSDGVVGLAFPALKRLQVPTFFSNMIKQGLIKKPIFTFYFNRDQSTERAGRLILGAIERKYVQNGSLIAVPVTEKMYWQINMDRVIVNETYHKKTYPFCKDTCEAIFDTSTNTITGPTDEINRINELINARSFIPKIFNMPRFMVSCRDAAKLPSIVFVIAGESFTIQSKYYVQHLVYESIEVCLSPFVPSNQTFWQLGGAFLMEFYTEYNYNTGQIMIGKTIF